MRAAVTLGLGDPHPRTAQKGQAFIQSFNPFHPTHFFLLPFCHTRPINIQRRASSSLASSPTPQRSKPAHTVRTHRCDGDRERRPSDAGPRRKFLVCAYPSFHAQKENRPQKGLASRGAKRGAGLKRRGGRAWRSRRARPNGRRPRCWVDPRAPAFLAVSYSPLGPPA